MANKRGVLVREDDPQKELRQAIIDKTYHTDRGLKEYINSRLPFPPY